MRLRVLILARANPAWTQYYVEAFRRAADVVVVGPPLNDKVRRRWFPTGMLPASVTPDVPVDFDAPCDLREALPPTFVPDLVVGISGLGGDPLPESVADFACPSAYITVDTWQCILNYPEARRYDCVFAAQREFVPRLKAVGARNVHWLPLACAPEHHHPVDVEPDADIAFAGSLSADIHARRRAVVEALHSRFEVAAYEDVFGDEACRVYARGRLGLNHCAVDEINMRVFEVMAMKRPLLVNRGPTRNGLLELFEDGRHLIVYDDPDDLLAKASRYLGDPAARSSIAQRGYDEVLTNHTYDRRVERILGIVQPVRQTAAWRSHDRLANFLPHRPGRILDVGMQLGTSRYALRRLGAMAFVGLSDNTFVRTSRRTSYDEVMAWPPAGEFDTVVFSLDLPGRSVSDALSGVAAVMPAGGVLLMRVKESVPDLAQVLSDNGFRLVATQVCKGDPIALARRCARNVRDVVFETFASHPETGYDRDEIASRVPENL